MNHIDLLKLCHAYLRGAEINEPTGRKPVDRDTLARLINLYLNQSCSAQNAEPQPEQLKLDFGAMDSSEGDTSA